MHRTLACLIAIASLSAVAQSHRQVKPVQKPVVEQPAPVHGPARLHMEGSVVKGQFNRSGGVYLVERKQLATRSMIVTPDSFRAEIVNPD